MNIALVFIGGGCGSVARWFVFRIMNQTMPQVPSLFSTLMVNAVGCLCIGFLAATAARGSFDHLKLFWLVGFLGGLTTFSTLGLDVFQLIQSKSFPYAVSYFFFHGLICISLVGLGNWLYSVR